MESSADDTFIREKSLEVLVLTLEGLHKEVTWNSRTPGILRLSEYLELQIFCLPCITVQL